MTSLTASPENNRNKTFQIPSFPINDDVRINNGPNSAGFFQNPELQGFLSRENLRGELLNGFMKLLRFNVIFNGGS
jgi:hypothetical protein